MFNQQKTNNQRPVKKGATSRDSAVTILTSGCHFEGKLYCRGSSRIAGRIEGRIISEGLLIIEDDAQITADIVADEAVIQGSVHGKLEAKTRIEMCATSRFNGDVTTPVLIVQEGARFNGRSTMMTADAAAITDEDAEPVHESEPTVQLGDSVAARTMSDFSPAS